MAGPTNNNTTFIITDNSSHTAKILPEKWIEPLAIISRVEGYGGMDDFVVNLVKDRLEMFTDTRDNLNEEFQEYMHNIMKGKDVPNEWAPKSRLEDDDDDDDAEDAEHVSAYTRRKGE